MTEAHAIELFHELDRVARRATRRSHAAEQPLARRDDQVRRRLVGMKRAEAGPVRPLLFQGHAARLDQGDEIGLRFDLLNEVFGEARHLMKVGGRKLEVGTEEEEEEGQVHLPCCRKRVRNRAASLSMSKAAREIVPSRKQAGSRTWSTRLSNSATAMIRPSPTSHSSMKGIGRTEVGGFLEGRAMGFRAVEKRVKSADDFLIGCTN